MSTGLYRENGPAGFWRLQLDPQPTELEWAGGVVAAAPLLPEAARRDWDGSIEALLESVLGEGQFGQGHWRLGWARRLYYAVKPGIPLRLRIEMRRWHRRFAESEFPLGWPVEPRFAQFQWGTLEHLLRLRGQSEVDFINFWPERARWAFVLTHDVETAQGQAHVRKLAALEAEYGFRSSFNFVAEGYQLDQGLIDDLRRQGFEVGVHGLRHDGSLFASQVGFLRQAARINDWMLTIGAEGFRSPLMHRHPAWMQALAIGYDMSFFDTDPYEPMPGGTMSIWPFTIGRFLELPTTLAQDHTLTAVLNERDPRLWLQKIDFIEKYCGLALLNAHPDYLLQPENWRIYRSFLEVIRARAEQPWHALPKEVAHWWRARHQAQSIDELAQGTLASFGVDPSGGTITIPSPPKRLRAVPELGELPPAGAAGA
jgi:hypothetical protein